MHHVYPGGSAPHIGQNVPKWGFEPGFKPIFFATWRGPTRERMVRSTPPPRSGAEGKFFTPKAYLHTSFCVQKMGDPELSFRLHRVLFCVEHKSTIPSAPLSRGPAVVKRGNFRKILHAHAYPPADPRRRPGPPGHPAAARAADSTAVQAHRTTGQKVESFSGQSSKCDRDQQGHQFTRRYRHRRIRVDA